MKSPEGKFMTTVKVGEKGQIVIPKGARDLFGIKPGDNLILLADTGQGIAIVPGNWYDAFFENLKEAKRQPPVEAEEEQTDECD